MRSLATVLLELSMSVAAADDRRFSVEVHAAAIDGSGEGYRSTYDRKIRDIDEGSGHGFVFAWNIDNHWFAKLSWAKSTLSYESPLDRACPLTAGYPFGFNYCQAFDYPREGGRIEEKLYETGIAVGFRHGLGDRYSAFYELGAKRASWQSSDDYEAKFMARCIPFHSILGFRTSERVPGCTQIRSNASETGVTAAVGGEVRLGKRTQFAASVHYQDFRHRIWRADVVVRWYDANCPGNMCIEQQDLRAAPIIAKRSWHWYDVQLDYRLSDDWVALLAYEGGGTRDWEIASLGLRYEWR